jgi:hypothetical protein
MGGGRQHQLLSPCGGRRPGNINSFLLVSGIEQLSPVERGMQHQHLSPGAEQRQATSTALSGWWTEADNINSSLLVVGRGRQHQKLSPCKWAEAGNIKSSLLVSGQRQATSIALSW